jgi:sigma-B regulation protein RsbU (phosphoserine phosphatase)
MASPEESSNFSRRLSDFAARFEEGGESAKGSAGESRVRDTLYRDLRELFLRDVTSEGLRDLIHRDARETIRFYARSVDFESLRALPWYRRYPAAAWKVFVALAHRLSPPRRIAFAVAAFAMAAGWIQFLVFCAGSGTDLSATGAFWLLLSFAIIIMLLLIELRDKLDLKGDFEIAREIQFGLVPSEPFHQDSIHIFYHMRPANTVGGDYYDIIRLDDNRIGVVVGDVSGKGMPAALLMALLLGSLRTLTTAGLRRTELIGQLNRYLCASIPSNRLVTLFYGELDTATGELDYINAGHNAPFLVRSTRELERLPSTSIVLGVDSGASYESVRTLMGPGDGLLLFTDGITEAFNARENEYGEERLASYLRRHPDLAPAELIRGIVEDVLAFCDNARPGDDITLMSITRQAS